MAVVMIILGGLLAGGAWSLYKQEFPKPVVVVCAALGAMAIAAGILWQV